MTSPARSNAKRQIARFLASVEQQIWDRIPQKKRDAYMTYAENILAIVERNTANVKWRSDLLDIT